jgi:hypothetical protein
MGFFPVSFAVFSSTAISRFADNVFSVAAILTAIGKFWLVPFVSYLNLIRSIWPRELCFNRPFLIFLRHVILIIILFA